MTPTPKTVEPGCTIYPSTDTPLAIPDPGTVNSTVNVPDSFTIADVNVRSLNITHTFDATLRVFLLSPQGTRVELFTNVGSLGDNFTNTTLDDEAAMSITAGTAPFTGSFRPEGVLSALDGENSAGTWRLEVTDTLASGGAGTLDSWQLELCQEITPTPTATDTPIPTATPTPTPTATPTPKDPNADNDGDTIPNGTDPDDDNDGCTDAQELGPNEVAGGGRDPAYFWDFMDQWLFNAEKNAWQRDGTVVLGDIGAVVARFGTFLVPEPTKSEALAAALTPPAALTGYHASADRGGADPQGDPWDLLPPDGAITVGDIGAVVAQFGHTCA